MRRPVIGTLAGSRRRSSRSACSMRRGDTWAARRWWAVRSSTTSWKPKRYSLRGPRPGLTKPARTRPSTLLRRRPSISSIWRSV
ncbi:hypothetical protein ABXN37_13905 [Piscinibacter sakaiensis]